MTFEEAGARFAQLQVQYRQGILPEPQFEQMTAGLRVLDPQQHWWQIEPHSGQWMMWTGAQWINPNAQAQMPVPPPSAARPAAVSPPAVGKAPKMAIWEGLASVAPGFVVEMVQHWPTYQKDTQQLIGFVVPSLLPSVLVPMASRLGRVLSILIVLGCLVWLSWPVISQAGAIVGNPAGVQKQAGRGLVGISLLYLIPRLWRAAKK